MLRFASVLLLSLALVPTALADGIAVGPKGIADPIRGDPYYVWIRPTGFEGPNTNASDTDDCGAGSRPALLASARGVADDVVAWDPMTNFGGGTWFPTCVSGTTGCDASMGTPCFPVNAPVKVYAAYNVATGRYYLEASSDALPGLAVDPKLTLTLTGSTGYGVLMDCVGCPPPGCCEA